MAQHATSGVVGGPGSVGVGGVGGGIAANNAPNMVAEPGAQLPGQSVGGTIGGGQQVPLPSGGTPGSGRWNSKCTKHGSGAWCSASCGSEWNGESEWGTAGASANWRHT